MAKMLGMVLSDLHLGEESSVLYYGDSFKEKGTQPLVTKLAETIKKRMGDEKIVLKFLDQGQI
jgi:metallophosphoesterase superfamily enzyme